MKSEELQGDSPVRKIICVDDRQLCDAANQKTFVTVGVGSEIVHLICPEGEQRTELVCVQAQRGENSEVAHTVGRVQDIAERTTMDQALRTSRENLSMVVELARLGPWEYNPETNLFEFGDEFYAIYGTDVAREGRFMAPDVYAREFVHPDDAWIVERQIRGHLFKGRYYSSQLEHRIIRRDGEVRTIMVRGNVIRDAAGNVVKWYGANQDITEQKQAGLALKESEERHNAILNALPDMLFRINAEGRLLDYRIPDQYWRYLVRMTDKYNTIYDILPITLAQRVKEMVISSLILGAIKMTEYSDQINGIDCFLQIRTAVINKKEVLVIIQDQTELYRVRREIQRLDSLDLIGKMAAGIGHEVRNPLTTVRGYLQFLASKEQFRNHAEMFSMMIDELDRSNAIITEFLALSKNKTVKLEPKNLNRIITAIYPLLEVDAIAENKNICLELDVNIPPIDVDESEIRQLIINFVRNGLEAMIGKGKLTIKTWWDDQNVMLVVRDNGPGIPESVVEQIGTPFVTTKEHGTGLGLSVCYSIAARHQATIDFKTDKNGTEFTVRFKSA